jgi:GT2 family glycosyltransferase
MISSGLYERFGGLRSIYVQGDYEDSDLCLQLAEAGYENWYLPDAELYHLEGQSQAVSSRQLHNRYNIWLHTRLWRERIEAMMEQYTLLGSDERLASGNERIRARRLSAATDSPTKEQDDVVKGSRTGRSDKLGKQRSGRKRHDG